MSTVHTAPINLKPFRIGYAIVALAILAVPLVAMQITTEVNWQAGDFMVFALMLAILGAAIEGSLRLLRDRWLRAIGIGMALTGFLFVWAMLATG